jgi:hypothetical protein
VLLQEPQELDLRGRGKLADFVEKQRPEVRFFHEAGFVAVRARERAFAVAEQLALEERVLDRAAVQGDEAALVPLRHAVDDAGEELLAGPAFAADEDRRGGGGDFHGELQTLDIAGEPAMRSFRNRCSSSRWSRVRSTRSDSLSITLLQSVSLSGFTR